MSRDASAPGIFRLQEWINTVFYNYGLFCATHQVSTMVFAIGSVLFVTYPLRDIPFLGNLPATYEIPLQDFRIPTEFYRPSAAPRWYHGEPIGFIQQILVKATVAPWDRKQLKETDAFRAPLHRVFNILNEVKNLKFNNSLTIDDICLRISEPDVATNEKNLLPTYDCLMLSPANLWNNQHEKFKLDDEVIRTVYESGRYSFEASPRLRDLLFGVPWLETGLSKFFLASRTRVIHYAVTIIYKQYNPDYIEAVTKRLHEVYPLSAANKRVDTISHVSYRESGNPTSYMLDYIPLFTAYLILFLYIYFSVRKINLVKSKWGLAFSAVVTVIASLLMSISICAVFGVTPSVNSGEIFPYLVVIIGLENVLVITGSVVNTKPSLEVKYRIAEGLRQEGWNITKHLITELTILFFGFFTFVPAIQEFCLFASIGLLVDFYLQMSFFTTTLSIDIKRLELSDLDHHHGMLEKTDRKAGGDGDESIMVASFFKTIPKRIKVMNFVAQFRVVQRMIIVCTIIWFSVLLYKMGIISSLAMTLSQYEDPSQPIISGTSQEGETTRLPSEVVNLLNTEALHPYISKVLFREDPPVETWKKLSFLHWPGVFALYNKPIVATYLSFLPSIKLSMIISPEEAIRLQNGHDDLSENTLELDEKIEIEDSLFYRIINGAQFRALSGKEKILIGMVTILIMVAIAWLLSVLYAVMCGRNYDKWRTGHRHQQQVDMYAGLLKDPVRFRMEGHSQPIECLVTDKNMVVTSCLAGDITVWNGDTGEARCQIKRSQFPSTINMDDDFKMRQQSISQGQMDSHHCRHSSQDIVQFDLAPFVETRFHTAEKKSFAECLQQIEQERRQSYALSSTPSSSGSYHHTSAASYTGLSSPVSPRSHLSHSSNESYEEFEMSVRSRANSDETQELSVFTESLAPANIWCLDVYDGLIVVGCGNGSIEFWDSSSGERKCCYFNAHNQSGFTSIKCVGTRVVAGRSNGYLDFYEVTYIVRSSQNPPTLPNVVKLHRRVRSVGNVTWREMDTSCSFLHSVKAHQSAVSLIDISGGRCLSGGEDTLIKVYRLETCALLYTLNGHDAPITVLQCDRLGNALSASEDGLIRLWDLFSGTCIQEFKGLTSPILQVETTPHYVVASSSDSMICIWDKSSGRLQHTIKSSCSNQIESGALTTLAGSLLVSGGRDFLHMWDLASGMQVMRCPLAVDPADNQPVLLNTYVSKLSVANQKTVISSAGSELYAVSFPKMVNLKYD